MGGSEVYSISHASHRMKPRLFDIEPVIDGNNVFEENEMNKSNNARSE
jgi:hypothetical protein